MLSGFELYPRRVPLFFGTHEKSWGMYTPYRIFFRCAAKSYPVQSRARARERRSRKTRETRAISRLAPSVTRVTICVSRVLLDGLQKKERLLVVYVNTYPICDSLEIGCAVTEIVPPQPFLCVNRSPNRYGFRGGPKVTRYSVDIALNFQRIFFT